LTSTGFVPDPKTGKSVAPLAEFQIFKVHFIMGTEMGKSHVPGQPVSSKKNANVVRPKL